jgi:hypothetical protein
MYLCVDDFIMMHTYFVLYAVCHLCSNSNLIHFLLFVAERACLRDQADAVTRAHCCTGCCILSKLGYEKGKEVVLDCMTKRDGMKRDENKNDLRGLIKVLIIIVVHSNMMRSCIERQYSHPSRQDVD